MVGVLVNRGAILGEGFHAAAGEDHAEVACLKSLLIQGRRVSKGATLYVTLEPCSTHGRTPPCTEAIVDAGIKEVVVGNLDPNPSHNGVGIERLREQGVSVRTGILERECRRLNKAFNHWIVTGKPWVLGKIAMTLDGKIATAAGQSKWITGEKSRQQAMRLRFESDAILVGIETVLQDDPHLTVRDGRLKKRRPLRPIILDSRARIPLTSRCLGDGNPARALVVVGEKASARRIDALKKVADVWVCPLGSNGRLNVAKLISHLGRERIIQLMVEGGGEVLGSFFDRALIDSVAFFYAPKILGGRDARPAFGGMGATRMEQLGRLRDVQWRRLGVDQLMTGDIEKVN